MGNGNSNPNIMVLQEIATQCHQTSLMVNQIGKMANEQKGILNKLIDVCGNFTLRGFGLLHWKYTPARYGFAL